MEKGVVTEEGVKVEEMVVVGMVGVVMGVPVATASVAVATSPVATGGSRQSRQSRQN